MNRSHVVDAENARPALVGEHVGGDRGGNPILDRPRRDSAQEGLSRGADRDRAAER
jgi:hypothetical protein